MKQGLKGLDHAVGFTDLWLDRNEGFWVKGP